MNFQMALALSFSALLALFTLGCGSEAGSRPDTGIVSLAFDATSTPGRTMTDSGVASRDALSPADSGSMPIPALQDATPNDMALGLDAAVNDASSPLSCTPTEDGVYAYSAVEFSGGEERRLCAYEGRVLMIVNTAANCGFSGQYEQLQALHQQYEPQGLTILGFLTNDFANQGGDRGEIEMCNERFGVTFEQFQLIGVTPNSPEGQHPLFAWLTSQQGFEGVVPWNFSKFLVSHDGRLLGRWDHLITPDNPSLVDPLRAALLDRVESLP